MQSFFRLAAVLAGIWFASMAHAQGAKVAVGLADHDSRQPVEAVSDELSIDQDNRIATFSGNVIITQGEMILTGAKVEIEYTEDQSIKRVTATRDVTLVNPTEAAEADLAVYTPKNNRIVLTGNVMLTQGGTAIAGDRLRINLESGDGVMDGRVRTLLQQNGDDG